MSEAFSNSEIEDNYVPHQWDTYPLTMGSGDEPVTREPSRQFTVCGIGSAAGNELLRHGDPQQLRFYVDYEQLAAGIDDKYGVGPLGELAQEWRGHPTGALALQVYTATEEDRMASTWMIERKG